MFSRPSLANMHVFGLVAALGRPSGRPDGGRRLGLMHEARLYTEGMVPIICLLYLLQVLA